MPDTLIVRLPNWLGDTIMAVPALRALRAAHAGRMALVGPWATLLAGQDLAEVLVPYPRAWGGRLARWDTVRALEPETIVLLPNSFEAALAGWYWRAPRRVGFDTGGRRRLLTQAIAMPEPREHQIDEYLRVAEPVAPGAIDRVPRLSAPPPESPAHAAVRELLRQVDVPGGGRGPVGIHLGAAYGASKLWPVERVAALCRLLSDRGETPLLLGPADALATARRLADETGVRSLVGRDSPELLLALLVALDALVCGDTGIGHLAAALGTPVVSLFGPTDPRLSAPRGHVRVVDHAVPCAPCFYRACPIDHPCLRGVTADEVGDAIEGLRASRGGVAR